LVPNEIVLQVLDSFLKEVASGVSLIPSQDISKNIFTVIKISK